MTVPVGPVGNVHGAAQVATGTGSAGPWAVEVRVGDAGSLHGSWPASEARPQQRAIAVCHVTRPALVLGSTQSDEVADLARADERGIDVVRRRSGGGVVLVAPDDPVWIDAWVPRGDPLWTADVVRAFDWFGDVWVEAIHRFGPADVAAHRGNYRSCTRWSSVVCFGGVGTGEVVTADGRKVVGMSQRRTRGGTWFHSATFLRWDPTGMLDVLDLSDGERAEARADLDAVVLPVTALVPAGTALDGDAVARAVIAVLP